MALPSEKIVTIISWITEETGATAFQVRNTVDLLQEGATVPFIARYRKEQTGELDEVKIRLIQERLAYLTELEERRTAILKSVE